MYDMSEDRPPESPPSPEEEAEQEWNLTGPLNEEGDRLLVRGKPSAMLDMIRRRSKQSKDAANVRLLGFLEEYCPDILEVCSREQRDRLIDLIRKLCCNTAAERDGYILEVWRESMKHIPTAQTIPDPLHSRNILKIPGDSGGIEETPAVDSGS